MKIYKQSAEDKRPRILALTYPLFNSTKTDIDKSDSESESETVDDDITDDDNFEVCEKLTQTTDDKEKDEEFIDNAEKYEKVIHDKNIIDKVEEMGRYENLDDFEMYEKLEWRIDDLEKELCCKIDLAEDIDGCKR